MMKPMDPPLLTTPRAAGLAGIAFSVLLTLALVLIRTSVPLDSVTPNGGWLSDPAKRASVNVAINIVPFAGIAFLWFIGVIRDRIGRHEDRFFATVMLGSGLLFIAMLFVSGAMAVGLTADASTAHTSAVGSGTWATGVKTTRYLVDIYAIRMAAVFTISVATVGLRTGVIPRWLAFAGFATAGVLFVSTLISPWTELLFPLWILILSIQILFRSMKSADPLEGSASSEPVTGDPA